MSRWLLVLALIAPASVLAEPRATRITVPAPTLDPVAEADPISHVIYLERCRGGCTVTKSNTNDAKAGLTILPQSPGTHTLSEFANKDGVVGAAADGEWNQLVACMREVYSPYDVLITDVKPAEGTYHLAIVAGFPSEVGFGSDILGVAPLSPSCSALDNVMSFSFANAHPDQLRINNLCWTAAQESAHAFGLDHTFKFLDGKSTCNDPMTYQVDCGGQRYFRNFAAKCGDFTEKKCRCGSTQNSHAKLLETFGPGTPTYGNPSSVITKPTGTDPLDGAITGMAGSKRGVFKVDLLVNGFPWARGKGVDFALGGQPTAEYKLVYPTTLPDGISDFVIRATDDLGAFTDSIAVTRTKGAPCVSADTCAVGQRCDAGRCFWDPPTREVGESCDYEQQCKSLSCVGTDPRICSEACNPDEENTCPGALTCSPLAPGEGVCYPETGGGCCSVPGRGMPWPQVVFGGLVVVLLIRRKRRR
jgi:hypothetical protein